MNLTIDVLELPPIGTNCYLVTNPETGEMAVFDAPLNAWQSAETRLVKSGGKLAGLYFTHAHWDHTLDGSKFAEKQTPTFGHIDDQFLFEQPEHMASYSIPGLDIKPILIDNWLKAGQTIQIAGRPVEVRHVPGHCPGSLLYWFKEDGFAITGDAIFQRSIGRTDFPGCSFEQLERSIQEQIYTLPDTTQLLPGHGPATSVQAEKRGNPFVKAKS